MESTDCSGTLSLPLTEGPSSVVVLGYASAPPPCMYVVSEVDVLIRLCTGGGSHVITVCSGSFSVERFDKILLVIVNGVNSLAVAVL